MKDARKRYGNIVWMFLVGMMVTVGGILLPSNPLQAAYQTDVPEGYTGIYTVGELHAIRNDLSGSYILMNDIDLTEVTAAEGGDDCGTGWDSIEKFSGTLDGNGYRIIGMQIFGEPEVKNVGLFEKLGSGAEIKNLGLENVKIDVHATGGGWVLVYRSPCRLCIQ